MWGDATAVATAPAAIARASGAAGEEGLLLFPQQDILFNPMFVISRRTSWLAALPKQRGRRLRPRDHPLHQNRGRRQRRPQKRTLSHIRSDQNGERHGHPQAQALETLDGAGHKRTRQQAAKPRKDSHRTVFGVKEMRDPPDAKRSEDQPVEPGCFHFDFSWQGGPPAHGTLRSPPYHSAPRQRFTSAFAKPARLRRRGPGPHSSPGFLRLAGCRSRLPLPSVM